MPDHRKARSQPEAAIVNECLLALSQAGCLAWRNNTGCLSDRNGRPVRYGLHKGSSDIIAVAPGGVFVAVECKTDAGRTTAEQDQFIAAVVAIGGRAGVARTGPEAVRIALNLPQTGQADDLFAGQKG